LPDDASDLGIDDVHEALAAKFLETNFKQSVVEPVKLHVAAKRYLCAVEPGYLATLSEPSIVSLKFQGGVMNEAEVETFKKNEFYQDAIILRKWDDLAKDADLVSPLLETFIPSIENALKK